ncbi:MAG: hypothetical protein ABIH38_05445 [Patescibacteria group bacterium]
MPQLKALEDLLLLSTDLEPFGRQFAVWLLGQSEGLTRNVRVVIPPDFPEPEKDKVAFGLHNINSFNGTTHIGVVLKAMGTDMRFSVAQHDDGVKAWLSTKMHDLDALEIPFDPEAIKALPSTRK